MLSRGLARTPVANIDGVIDVMQAAFVDKLDSMAGFAGRGRLVPTPGAQRV